MMTNTSASSAATNSVIGRVILVLLASITNAELFIETPKSSFCFGRGEANTNSDSPLVTFYCRLVCVIDWNSKKKYAFLRSEGGRRKAEGGRRKGQAGSCSTSSAGVLD